ncbi:hypothetical protein CKJ84_08300, partial [Corynebacterium sp. NML 120412]
MAVHFSIDLTDATYADLVALVEGARVAGVDKRAALHLEDTTLSLEVEPDARTERSAAREHAPVSYTHLDVYKRQTEVCLAICAGAEVPEWVREDAPRVMH